MWYHTVIGQKVLKLITWELSNSRQFMFFVCFLSFFSIVPINLSIPTRCGGIYRASRGIIQTPDFPRQFQTPIKFEWVIDASHIAHCTYNTAYSTRADGNKRTGGSSNHSIVIYFTQVYVLTGLSFTEYYNYSNCENDLGRDADFKGEGRNIVVDPFTATYIQSCANFLVIRLDLESVVGTHVRVLNNFLDVYGFNITYEISSVIRNNTCKMSTCGFTGYCYDNFEGFFCDCLPGFKGLHCSDGPKSVCMRNGVSICKDSASYKLVGETACLCGNLTRKIGKSRSKDNSTEKLLTKSIKNQQKFIRDYRKCADCRISCPFNKKYKRVCDCSRSLKEVHNPQDVRYSASISVNIRTLENDSIRIEDYFQKQIIRTLQICKARTNKVTIEKIEHIENDIFMYVYFSGIRADQHELQNCFRNFSNNEPGNFTFIANNVTLSMEPTLFLEKLANNKRQEIHEGQEFILSCMAIGSPNMAFRWYKDNMFINITTPTKSNKWMQLIRKDTNNNSEGGAYWSVLVVSDANELDEGLFTCQVIDDGRQQCASQRISITVAPTVFTEPMSLTVKQGEAFIIKCRDSSRSTNTGSCHFNWLQDGIPLLNVAESLYPVGSLLKIPGIEKKTTYTCSNSCITNDIVKEATITVYVYDSSKEIPCTASNIEQNLVHWPDTIPHALSIVECPEDYTGFVSRMCLPSNYTSNSRITKGKVIGEWAEPDYSGCLHYNLEFIQKSFEKLELGYEYTTALKIISEYKRHVIGMDEHILSSEGRRIFLLIDDVLTYVEHSTNFQNIQSITNDVLEITDVLLRNTNAIYTKSDIIIMQKVLKRTILLYAKTVETFQFLRDEYDITLNNNCNDQSHGGKVLCIYYFKLMQKVSKVANDSASKYHVISDIKTVLVLNTTVDEANELTVSFNITDWVKLEQVIKLHDEWKIQCVVSDWGFDWNESACTTIIDIGRHVVTCRCETDGTFAVAYVQKLNINSGTIEVNQVLIPLLYAISLLLSLACVMITIIQFKSNKSAVSFMLSHSSISKLTVCIIFAIGTCSKFPQESYLYVLTAILFSYLLALSSQLSIIMITYSELENVLYKEGAKIALVEIFIVGSVLVTIGNHIAHSSNALRSPSWWIKIADNLSFNVFIICLAVMMVLFVSLYWIVWNFIRKQINMGSIFMHKKYNRIRKSSYVFCAFLSNVLVSIVYINFAENMVLNYVLVFTFILIDCMILIFITDCQRLHLKEILLK